MATRCVKLTFPQALIKEPVTFRMAQQFGIVPNIRRARVTETVGELVLELEGAEESLQRGIEHLRSLGVEVSEIEGDILE